jgi:hypothetical protein
MEVAVNQTQRLKVLNALLNSFKVILKEIYQKIVTNKNI